MSISFILLVADINFLVSLCVFNSFGCKIAEESRFLAWKKSDLNSSPTPYKLYNLEYMFLLGLSEEKMKSEH